jgi:hypothetical protein
MASEWMVLSESANRCPLTDSVRRLNPVGLQEHLWDGYGACETIPLSK